MDNTRGDGLRTALHEDFRKYLKLAGKYLGSINTKEISNMLDLYREAESIASDLVREHQEYQESEIRREHARKESTQFKDIPI